MLSMEQPLNSSKRRMTNTENAIGIDEVGRGCLAGPVCAAGVIMCPNALDKLCVNDSKKLSAQARASLVVEIINNASAWSVGIASVEEIDHLNILQATLLAMRRVVAFCPQKPEHAWVDGRDDPRLEIPTKTVIQGDANVPIIACASIIAKVFRDKLMAAYDLQYPGYGLAKHMGYGTKAHLSALDTLGITPIHRKSFKPVALRWEQQKIISGR